MSNDDKLPPPSNDDVETEVGYGKPPKEHRFKKGQSGNPKGRRAKSSSDINLYDLFRDEYTRMITVTENGKSKKMPLFQVVLRREATSIAKGDRPFPRHILDRLLIASQSSARTREQIIKEAVLEMLVKEDPGIPTEPGPKKPIL